MLSSDFALNWFDFVVLLVLGLGVYRGRLRGMSEELLDVLKWLTIVVVGGIAYRPIGMQVADYTHVSPLLAFLLVYFSVLVVVRIAFGWVKRMVGEKLVGSDVFGSGEYYLGMLAGGVRFACYLIFGMALLNAKYVSPEQLAAEARVQKDNFGDISFPTLGNVQQTVFVGSASGNFAKRYLRDQLIITSPKETSVAKANTLGRQRESVINEVLGK